MDFIKDKKCEVVFINATITAKGFYEKMGFEVVEEKVFNIRGADVNTYYMQKKLTY